MDNVWFFEDVEFVGKEKVRDFVFEKENNNIPPVVIDNDQDQDPIPDIVQEATPD